MLGDKKQHLDPWIEIIAIFVSSHLSSERLPTFQILFFYQLRMKTNTFRYLLLTRACVWYNRTLSMFGHGHVWSMCCFFSLCFYFKKERKNKIKIKKSSFGLVQQPLWTGNTSKSNAFHCSEVPLSLSLFLPPPTPIRTHACGCLLVSGQTIPLSANILDACFNVLFPLWALCHFASAAANEESAWVSCGRGGPTLVALGRNDFFPYRKAFCCLELRNARNVHNWSPIFFFFQPSSSTLPLLSKPPCGVCFSRWGVTLLPYCMHTHPSTV